LAEFEVQKYLPSFPYRATDLLPSAHQINPSNLGRTGNTDLSDQWRETKVYVYMFEVVIYVFLRLN